MFVLKNVKFPGPRKRLYPYKTPPHNSQASITRRVSKKIPYIWDSNCYKNLHPIYFVCDQMFPQDEKDVRDKS
jgi:hypothetical protein